MRRSESKNYPASTCQDPPAKIRSVPPIVILRAHSKRTSALEVPHLALQTPEPSHVATHRKSPPQRLVIMHVDVFGWSASSVLSPQRPHSASASAQTSPAPA